MAWSLIMHKNFTCTLRLAASRAMTIYIVRVSQGVYQRFEEACCPHLQGRLLRNYTVSEVIRPLAKLFVCRLQ